jgi:large subunit ribosomal protein L17
MRHRVAGKKLGRTTSHRRALYRNLVTDLLKYEKVITTEAKAKEVCSLAEKMITLGKKSGLSSYRQALSFIMNEKVTEKLFAELAPRYSERPGGYTRIVKLEPRLGDGAPMVQLKLVE